MRVWHDIFLFIFIKLAWFVFFFPSETGMILIIGCFNVSQILMYKSIQKHFSFLVHVQNLNHASPAWFLFLNIIWYFNQQNVLFVKKKSTKCINQYAILSKT